MNAFAYIASGGALVAIVVLMGLAEKADHQRFEAHCRWVAERYGLELISYHGVTAVTQAPDGVRLVCGVSWTEATEDADWVPLLIDRTTRRELPRLAAMTVEAAPAERNGRR